MFQNIFISSMKKKICFNLANRFFLIKINKKVYWLIIYLFVFNGNVIIILRATHRVLHRVAKYYEPLFQLIVIIITKNLTIIIIKIHFNYIFIIKTMTIIIIRGRIIAILILKVSRYNFTNVMYHIFLINV